MTFKVGDWVQVVKPRFCGCPDNLGYVFQVQEILHKDAHGAGCLKCAKIEYIPDLVQLVCHEPRFAPDARRCVKLPDLEPEDKQVTDKELEHT